MSCIVYHSLTRVSPSVVFFGGLLLLFCGMDWYVAAVEEMIKSVQSITSLIDGDSVSIVQ